MNVELIMILQKYAELSGRLKAAVEFQNWQRVKEISEEFESLSVEGVKI